MTSSKIVLLLIIVALYKHIKTTLNVDNGLIFNGTKFNKDDYPYVMFIRIELPGEKIFKCTGSLITELLVLTAAHCCYEREITDIKVCQGSRFKDEVDYDYKTDWHYVDKIYVHEKYSPSSLERDDICVLKLAKGFPNIKTFSKIGGSPDDFANGKKLSCTIIGFGAIADVDDVVTDNGLFGRITTVDVVYGEKACINPDKAIQKSWEQHLCLVPGDSTPCQGDSGGPMICNNLQYGTCGFKYDPYGTAEVSNVDCTNRNVQSIYIFLHYHKKWLKNIMEPKNKEEKKKKKNKEEKKRKRSSGNFLKPRHYYSLYIILTILLCNMFTFI